MKKKLVFIIVAYCVVCLLRLGCFVAPSPFQKYTLLLPYDRVCNTFSRIIESDSSQIYYGTGSNTLISIDGDGKHFSIVLSDEKIRFSGNLDSINDKTSECSLFNIEYMESSYGTSRGGSSMKTSIADGIHGKRIFETEILSKVGDWKRQFPPIFDTLVYFLYRNFKIISYLFIVAIVFFIVLNIFSIDRFCNKSDLKRDR